MFDRIEQSWELIKASARVLRADPELLVFPLIAAIGVVVVSASLAVPLFASGVLEHAHRDSALQGVLGLGVSFVFYLAIYSVIFFCNSALVGCALIRLRGGDPTVSDGLRLAAARLPQILGYALLSATVGVALKYLIERLGFIGRIIVNLMGAAWNVITFLTVPVLVTENVGAWDAVKRSSELLKKTWGEQAIGNLGIGLAFFWISLATSAVMVTLLVGLAMLGSPVLVGMAFILGIVWFSMLSLIHAALHGVYTAAVYRYASEGAMSGGFSPDHIQRAFATKR